MNEDVTRLLMRDLDRAEEQRNWTRPDQNYEVTREMYLNPDMGDAVLPLGHPHGRFMYFQKMIEILQDALNTGSIPADSVPKFSPAYIEDLAEGN